MDRVRVGVIGCGDIAFRRYLPGFASIADRAEIAGVYDRLAERAHHAAATYGTRAYDSLDSLLEDERVDAVLNLTQPAQHARISLAVLGAGKHLLTEKVLATTMDDADLIIRTAAASQRTLVCAPAVAVSPFLLDIRQALSQGIIGQVTGARVHMATFGPAAWSEYTSDPSWFYEPGAGPLADIGVYPLHLLTDLLGPVRRMTALSGISVPRRTVLVGEHIGQPLTVSVDDNVQMLLDFTADGQLATFANLDCTYCAWASESPFLEIFGTEGVLSMRDLYDSAGEVRVCRAGGEWGILPRTAPARAGQRGMDIFGGVVHLVDCVQGNLEPILSGEHARHVLEIILGAEQAARGGSCLAVTSTFSRRDR